MAPLARGFWFALLAALSFGITTPLIALVGHDVGPWASAAWLYLGGTIFAATLQRTPRALAFDVRTNGALLAAVAVVGGMLAPAAYLYGLRASGPLATSLALNMEAPFSVGLAALLFHEHIGRRVVLAMTAIVGAATLLTISHESGGGLSLGVLLVVLATALWAIDNILAARLRDIAPAVIVFWKSSLGSLLCLAAAAIDHETFGGPTAAVALIVIGIVGYGASLFWFLRAQQTFGVARASSVFATAPFIGAIGSVVLGASRLSLQNAGAFALMLLGVGLHASERHTHAHHHEAIEHEHAHVHGDLHHDHVHDPPVIGEHSHAHQHRAREHTHEHAFDADHDHTHV